VIVLIATYRGQPGTGDAIEPLLAELAGASRTEAGNSLYLVNRSTTAPDTFVIYEHYADEGALAAHRESPHFQRLAVGQIIPMLEERVFDVYRLVDVPPG
jgi:quinol monooxygenase YgiN